MAAILIVELFNIFALYCHVEGSGPTKFNVHCSNGQCRRELMSEYLINQKGTIGWIPHCQFNVYESSKLTEVVEESYQGNEVSAKTGMYVLSNVLLVQMQCSI